MNRTHARALSNPWILSGLAAAVVLVAVASFAGSTGGGFARAAGRSSIWSPEGVVVARAGPETGAIARATLV